VREINFPMKLAADTIASPTVKPGLAPEVLDPDVHESVAEAVRKAAVKRGAVRASAGGVTAAARGRSRRWELNDRRRRR
jgi:malic enzyme